MRYLSVQQAADALGVPRRHISDLIKRGQLHTEVNPLDRQSKLIPAAEIERLARLPRAPRRRRVLPTEASESRPRPRTFDMAVYEPGLQSDEIDGYRREHWHPEYLERIRHLIARYGDLPLGFAAAAVVACAERHGGQVLTTDRRHFPVVARREKTLTPLPLSDAG